MNSYKGLAQYYQMFTLEDCDYNVWSQYLYSILSQHQARKGVDLACGTGKMTRLLAKHGLNVVGIDNSIDMLNIARQQGRGQYVCQDMLQLQLPNVVDFVTIVNDGVNYISQDNIDQLFDNISNVLCDKGVLIFDISSSYKLGSVIGDNVFYRDMDNVTCLWSNTLHADRVVMDIVLFDSDDGCNYTRTDEQHVQYIHQHDDVISALDRAGFDCYAVDCYTNANISDNTHRITYIATKRGR